MNKVLKTIFSFDKKPRKGLFAFEWSVLAYLLLTLLMVFICYTDLVCPEEMISGRVEVVLMTLVAWGVYRLLPCRMTVVLRVAAQGAFLPWWYADTYELNRILPNLDHVFAMAEQSLFGYQPSLTFSEACPWRFFSEVMYLGYYSYFYLLAFTAVLYLFCRYQEFTKVIGVIFASFFAYYFFFDLVPVVGPQYYYQAIGLDKVMAGVFPDVGTYFKTHSELFPAPGDDGGFFRQFEESGAERDGERPTAAFPSSHVGLSTVIACMLVRLCHLRHDWRPMIIFAPLYVSLCFATVYIHAHYAIDAIAGLVTGAALYFFFWRIIKE